MNTSVLRYLRPEVIARVSRLDLRARFIVEGFLSGLHALREHSYLLRFILLPEIDSSSDCERNEKEN